MNALRKLTRALFFTILLVLFAAPGSLLAQNQTNDPLVDEQQYLFDVHNVDQAWSYTKGSSNVRIGVYSFLGFTPNHEDLNGTRLETPRGPLRPEFDYATEVAGIAGANTNNGLGVAGVDRKAHLQSYSMLRTTSSGNDTEREVTVGDETFYLDLSRIADRFREGRNNGVGVHLALIGVPSGIEVDYEEEPVEIEAPESESPMLPNPFEYTDPPNRDEIAQEQRRKAYKSIRDIFQELIDQACFGSGCDSPPDPMVDFRQAVGNATRLDGGVVVTPAGDLGNSTSSSDLSVSPGRLGRYAVTVGGLQYNDERRLVKWEHSNAAPYVDVAGFATGLAGPSALGFSAYDTEFTSTAGAAGIGAGVAGLLRAENPNFTSEDVDQILKRTARDVGQPGEDDGTGAGRIDAGAALAYVNNNDVQRAQQSVEHVITDEVVATDVPLNDSGYWNHVGRSCGYGKLTVKGDLHKFTAEVPYSQTFRQAPDVWVRWANSNGYKSAVYQNVAAWFDPFRKDLRVVDSDGRGLTVEGYYWVADFYNRQKERCGNNVRIPKSPGDFKIAYAAVGTEGPPPVKVTLSGPTILESGQQGTWTASASGGVGSTSYDWEYSPVGSVGWSDVSCTGSSCSYVFYNTSGSPKGAGMKVTITRGTETDAASMTTSIQPSSCQYFCEKARRALVRSVSAEAEGAAVTLRWTTGAPASEFVVQHRRDSTAAWTEVGRVAASDSVAADTSRGATYRFRMEDLTVGTHQFRLRGQAEEAKKELTSRTVSAEIRLKEAYEVTTYPNPVRTRATIELALREKQDVTVAIYDVLGRQVATLHDGPVPAQEMRRFRLNASEAGLSSGTYFVRVRGNEFVDTRRLSVVR